MMKKTVFPLILAIAAAVLPGGLDAAERMTVAVLDLTPKGVPGIVSGAVSDIMRAEFSNYTNFIVVARNQMKEILEEQSFQMTGCTDEACAVQAGKLLSARRIVTGEVTSLGKKIMITARYIDVEKGVSLFSERGVGESIDVVDRTATEVAKKLAVRIVGGDREVIQIKSPVIYYSLSVVPGVGQFYAGKPGEGIAYASMGGIAATVTWFAYANYKSKSDAYHNLGRGSTEYESKYDEYKKAGTYFNYSLYFLGAVYLAHWIDVIFFARPDFTGGAAETAVRGTFFDYQCYVNDAELYPERVYAFSFGYRF
jgi:TolB-like protein